jgi:hypothetical protein
MDGDTLLILFYMLLVPFLYVIGIFIGLIIVFGLKSIRNHIKYNQFNRCIKDMHQYGLTPAEAYTAHMMK